MKTPLHPAAESKAWWTASGQTREEGGGVNGGYGHFLPFLAGNIGALEIPFSILASKPYEVNNLS